MNIVCVSHLRWDFVFQRPQHLLSRAAREGRVLYVEEPTPIAGHIADRCHRALSGVLVAVPRILRACRPLSGARMQRRLLREAMPAHVPGSLCALVLHADGAAVHARS